ncbi:MAG: glycosyltransferase [Desulfovibrio sp.]
MTHAPVALFCYNRPEHLTLTLDALAANPEFARTRVYAFCDGPRSEEDAARVQAVRDLLRSRSREMDLEMVEQPKNLGLRTAIVQGVSQVCAEHGRVIVVEDDIVTSPHFLGYMNAALNRYEDTPEVMHVSGYFLPVNPQGLPETLFYRPASCWGWATWAESWSHLDLDAEGLLSRLQGEAGERFDLDGAYNFRHHLELNIQGKFFTWAIFWYATIFLRGGLCLHPSVSLTRNIGHDGGGTNCKPTSCFMGNLRTEPVRNFPKALEENPLALERIRQFYIANRGKV